MSYLRKNSAVILAAGSSARMGRPKFALKAYGGITFLETLSSAFYNLLFDEVIVVMSNEGIALYERLKINLPPVVKIVVNDKPERGRFLSLKTGLKNMRNIENVFIHNVDNPFIEPEVIKQLQTEIAGYDYCVPVYKGRGGHPLLITGKLVSSILDEPEDGAVLREYLKRFKGKRVEVSTGKVLTNINSPDQYEKLLSDPDNLI